MAGVATKAKRQKPAKFKPPRSHGIQTVEDQAAAAGEAWGPVAGGKLGDLAEERIAVPLSQEPDVDPDDENDPWYDQGPDTPVSESDLRAFYKTYSADTLSAKKPKIRGTFEYAGKRWVCTGALTKGEGVLEVDACELVPGPAWKFGTYSRLDNDHKRRHLFYGVGVVHRADSFVLGAERRRFLPAKANGLLPTEAELIDRFLEALPPAVRRQVLAQQSRESQVQELRDLCGNGKVSIGSRAFGNEITGGPHELHAQQSDTMTAIIKWDKVLDRLLHAAQPSTNGKHRKSRPVVCDCPEATAGAHLPTCEAVAKYTRRMLSTTTPPAAPAEQLGKLISIAVDDIRPNPFQPRQEFDQAKLQELAHSIKTHGMRQPLDVRLVDDDYELVAGERRLRAARLAGLAEVPAILKVTSDRESREIALIENVDREDLSDIEKARAFKGLIEHNGYTAETLAARLKGPAGEQRSRSYVANLIRLLDLPEAWQQRVVSHEMPSTHARYLLPYKDAPGILAAVAKHVKERGLSPLKTWDDDLNRIVKEAAAPLFRSVHNDGYSAHGEVRIDPKHPQYSELQVVEVKSWNGKQKVALNAPLARKLLGEKAKAWHERHPSEKAKPGKGGKHKPTPAELAALAKAKREVFEKGLSALVCRWWLAAAAASIRQELPAGACERLLLYFVANDNGRCGCDRFLSKHWNLPKLRWPQSEQKLAEEILTGRAVPWHQLFAHVLQEWAEEFKNTHYAQHGAERELPVIRAIGALLGVDPSEDWYQKRPDGGQVLMGPFTDEYFELHSETQLRDLCEGWDLDLPQRSDLGKDEVIDLIGAMASTATTQLVFPDELNDLLSGGKPKKAAKRPRKAK